MDSKNNTKLKEKKCVPCRSGMGKIEKDIAEILITQTPRWELGDNVIQRKFKFKDFNRAFSFVTKVASLAEEEGHHPDIQITYNRVLLELTTHAAGGLTENDFIMAAKINDLHEKPE